MKSSIPIIGLLALPAAWAAGEPARLDLKSSGEYFLVEKGGSTTKPTLVVRRVGPSGTSYTKRAFDCEARTAMHVGSGDTLETMAKARPDGEMAPLVKDSVTEQLWHMACKK